MSELSQAMNCPPDYAAVPMLVLAGSAIGNAIHLSLVSGYNQAPCLYAAIVGPPGCGKSPVLDKLRHPFDEMQAKYLETFKKEMEEWKSKEEDDEDRGLRPILKRCMVDDITTESLILTLHENPRGFPTIRDELVSLVASMNQYKGGRGQDRQVYLSLWGGPTITTDRKWDNSRDGAPLFARKPFACIVGGLQPAVLRDLISDNARKRAETDDGFLDRFLFSFPEPLKAVGEQWIGVSDTARAVWAEVVTKLLERNMVGTSKPTPPITDDTAEVGFFSVTVPTTDEDGPLRPYYVKLSSCGRLAWKQFTDLHAAQLNDEEFPAFLVGPWSKLRGYCARLALIVHCLRRVGGEVHGEDVDGESMDRAARLVAYFKEHNQKVYAAIGADPKVGGARRVVRWIIENRLKGFSKRDAFEGLKGTFRTVDELDIVLAVVEKHGLIRPEPTKEHFGRGRKPSPMFEVHPEVISNPSHYSQNSQNSTPGDAWEGDCYLKPANRGQSVELK